MVPFSDIHKKLFPHSAEVAIDLILKTYREQGFAITHFLYFANAHFGHLYRGKQNSEQEAYFRALLASDVLLPDGIALSLVHYRYAHREISGFSLVSRYAKYAKQSLHNLNGTDLVPELLAEAVKQYGTKNVSLAMYGALPEVIEKAKEKIHEMLGIEAFAQNGYEPFDFTYFSEPKRAKEIRILLVGRGSPKQELFVEEHREIWKKDGVLVLSVGGLFDFWGGYETRAPSIMRKIRGEWIWRLLTNPGKNSRKVIASFFSFRELFFPKK